MKFLTYRTYPHTPNGLTAKKWGFDRQYGTGGKSGWHVTLTIFCRVFQIRHDVF